MKYVVRAFGTIAACLLMLAMVACNTTKGMGEDLEAAGEGIQDSADEHGAD